MTEMPADNILLDPDRRYLVSVGAAGEPENADEVVARYVVFDSSSGKLFFRAVEFDADAYKDDLVAAGFALRRCPFPDHHRFTPADFKDLTGLPIIMTEKDAVKCRGFAGPGAWSLGIRVDLPPAIVDGVRQVASADSPTG